MNVEHPPLRGASAIDDELEVGFDENFEGRWALIERRSQVIMIGVVLAALSGLLGQGPLSHHTTWTPDGRLAVDFEPLARFGTSTQVTLHLSSSDQHIAPVRAIVSSSVVEPMGLQQIIPAPAQSESLARELGYTFDIAAGRDGGLVRFVFKPAVIGPVRLYAKVGDEEVSWTQWVLP